MAVFGTDMTVNAVPANPKQTLSIGDKKISRNKERDAKEQKALRVMGWNILVVWECELKMENCETLRERIMDFLKAENLESK